MRPDDRRWLSGFSSVENTIKNSLFFNSFLTNSMSLQIYNEGSKGGTMELEIYADSLLLICFPIQFGLLEYVNVKYNSASLGRMMAASAVGSVFFLLSFGGGRFFWVKTALCILLGNVVMLRIAFPVKGFIPFLNTLEECVKGSVLMGGIMALLLKILPVRRLGFWGTWGIVLLSNILILLLRGRAKQGLDRKEFCRVVLIQGKDRVELDAIVDTGNSLEEPISRAPVNIIPGEVLRKFWQDDDAPCRMVPFCSIAQKGMLKAYLLDELVVNRNGHEKRFAKVYVAACSSSVEQKIKKMILNPRLFTK